ncbi:MAG TPA: hypothetical protein VKZ85_02120 [Woeseiaceae bacterium]|nr:hypothetical protein [Woeseiaceae bacterium]
MSRNLDWKWIGIGVLIMVALNIVAGLLLAPFLGPGVEGATSMEDVDLGAGQMAMLALVNFLIFVIGGFIVGVKSAGRTILEPGISAALAVLLALLVWQNFSIGNLIGSALVPFLAGVLGGWLGERRQEARGHEPVR